MKKYFGSPMDAVMVFVIIPMMQILFLGFIIFLFNESEILAAIIFIGLGIVEFLLIGYLFFIQNRGYMYSWGELKENGIMVSSLGRRKCFLKYSKCIYIGLGCYGHTGPSGQIAFVPTYIIFSDEPVSELEQCNINRWKLSAGKLKIGFSQERYEYLLKVLPHHHAQTLRADYIRLYGTE